MSGATAETQKSSLDKFPAWRSISWPNGALVAVQVLIAFEAFEEHSQFTTEAAGGLNPFSISYGEYGAHVGAWRLMEMMEAEGVVSSVATNGKAAATHPEVVAAFAERGHELVAHGWANDLLMTGGEAEREVVTKTIAAIEDAAGVKPAGWVSPGKMGSPDTERFLVEAGLRYTGDDASDDLPFVKDVGGTPLAVVPTVDLASNDLLQWALTGQGPGVIAEGFRVTFDAIYREALRGRPGSIGLVLHCHAAGRPTLTALAQELIHYCKGHSDVWFARGDEIADWAIEKGYRR